MFGRTCCRVTGCLLVLLLALEIQDVTEGFPILHYGLEAGLPLLWMWLFPDDITSQLNGCRMLRQYGFNDPSAKQPLRELGAIDLAIRAVERFAQSPDVQEACLGASSGLCLFNEFNSKYAGARGAVEQVAAAMRRFGHEERFVLGGTFGCFNDFAEENRIRMRKAGGIKLLLDACGINGTHYWSAGAQFSVWCGFSSYHNTDSYAEFQRLGGIESMVAVMRDHGKSYRVREEVLQCTKGMCGMAHYRDALVAAGFVEQLLAALREDRDDPQVQALGFDTLRLMTETNESLRNRTMSLGGLELAAEALSVHSGGLKDTRRGGDSQHVYGSLNDIMYNVPGASSEVLSALVQDSAAHEAAFAANVPEILDKAMWAVRWGHWEERTTHGACTTLLLLRKGVSEEDKRARELDGMLLRHQCARFHGLRPPVTCNYRWDGR